MEWNGMEWNGMEWNGDKGSSDAIRGVRRTVTHLLQPLRADFMHMHLI